MKYKLKTRGNWGALETAVNLLIDDGWKPVGGAFAHGNKDELFTQTMIKDNQQECGKDGK